MPDEQGQPADTTGGAGASAPPPGFELSDEQHRRAREAFVSVLENAALAYEIGQLRLFNNDDEETHLDREVERMLWEPKLPNGGSKERRIIERLKAMCRDRNWNGVRAAEDMIKAYQRTLPDNPRNAGCYYIRKELTRHADKELYDWLKDTQDAARKSREWSKVWFCDLLLAGEPEAVSDFEMQCLFLLRTSDGKVDRLVRLRNVVGEQTKGQHHAQAIVLDGESFCSPEKYRKWALSHGNFAFSGNQNALHLLILDNDRSNAWRVINRVDSVGWLEVGKTKVLTAKEEMEMKKNKIKSIGFSEVEGAGRLNVSRLKSGIWFCDGCALANDGEILLPDSEGIYWWQGEGYYLNRKGRESSFSQGRPKMSPGMSVKKTAEGGWELAAEPQNRAHFGEFYREVAGRFYDTLGGYEGWLAMGAMFAYAVGPEVFAEFGLFPGLFMHGQMASGKTKAMEWLMHLWGYQKSAGIGLLKGSAVGLLQEAENYSNQPLWVDEFRAERIKEDKEAALRDGYNRQPQVKWSPDGVQRDMRTMFVVTGESTSSDAAMRSRYSHVQVSATKRLANHLEWMDANKSKFFVLCRALLLHRENFYCRFRTYLEEWSDAPKTAGIDDREKLGHGIHWAAFEAATRVFDEIAGSPETNDQILRDPFANNHAQKFLDYMVEHSRGSAVDVMSETNVNVFLTDLLTGVKAGQIDSRCFRLEEGHATHAPDRPNQATGWRSYKVFIDPEATISQLNIFLAKERRSMALRRKDLRDQLSRLRGWIDGKITKKFGPPGDMSSVKCWGFNLDEMEMGYQPSTDEEVNEFLMSQDENAADPRQGPFYAIVHLLKNEAKKEAQARR